MPALRWSERKKAESEDPLLGCPPHLKGHAGERLRTVPPPFDYVTVDVVEVTGEVCVSVWKGGKNWEIWGLKLRGKKWKLTEKVGE